jgi:hypothetical protein
MTYKYVLLFHKGVKICKFYVYLFIFYLVGNHFLINKSAIYDIGF